MACSILEVFLNAKVNFENFEIMNPIIKGNPLYVIAKNQFDNALNAIYKGGKKLDDIYEDEVVKNLKSYIDRVKSSDRVQNCRSCGAEIYWIKTDRGKAMPINKEDGISHFATCPQADKWRKDNE